MTRVLIEPRRIRNCFLENSEIDDEIIAAWLLPKPGKNEARGEMIAVVTTGLIICFFVMRSFVIFCFGIFVFCEIEYSRVEEPKSPVSRGRREFFTGRFRVAIPRKPARRKMINAQSFDSFSL